MGGTPFNAEKSAGWNFGARSGHGRSIFRLWQFASVAAWKANGNEVWSSGMSESEQALHAVLVELEAAAKPVPAGSARPNLMPLFERIDALTASLPADADRELLHFLHRKSYEKAREWLAAQIH
jgi:hypothetical protein